MSRQRKASPRPKAFDFEITLTVRGFGTSPQEAFDGALTALKEDFDGAAIVDDVIFDDLGDAQATLVMGIVDGVQ